MLSFTFAGFEIQHITTRENLLVITARALAKTGICPSCGEESSHIHSSYQRHPQDLPISGRQVQLVVSVRRFRCRNARCTQHIFAERLPELPVSARQTSRLATVLERIAIVLSGQAGSRLTEHLAMPVSADTLLRRVKKKSPLPPTPRVLGVDDFGATRSYRCSCKTFSRRILPGILLPVPRPGLNEVRLGQCSRAHSGGLDAVRTGDIKGCFDAISHEWLLTHIPMEKAMLKKWLKAGYMEQHILYPTEAGTPQGGIISPVSEYDARRTRTGDTRGHSSNHAESP